MKKILLIIILVGLSLNIAYVIFSDAEPKEKDVMDMTPEEAINYFQIELMKLEVEFMAYDATYNIVKSNKK